MLFYILSDNCLKINTDLAREIESCKTPKRIQKAKVNSVNYCAILNLKLKIIAQKQDHRKGGGGGGGDTILKTSFRKMKNFSAISTSIV